MALGWREKGICPTPALQSREEAGQKGVMKGFSLKKIVVCLLAVAVICTASLGAVSFFFNGSYLAGRISAAFTDAGHSLVFRQTPVSSLFPPRLDFGQIAGTLQVGSIFIDFTVESGSAEPDLMALLSGKWALDKLTLNRPVLKLKPAPATQGAGSDFPEIGHLFVQDAQVDFVGPAGRLLLADLKLAGQNIRLRKDMDLQCDCVLDWSTLAGSSLTGNLALQTKLRYYAPALTFRETALSFTATDKGFLSQYSPLQIHLEGGLDLQELRPRVRSFELSVPDLRLAGNGEFQDGKFAGKFSLETALSLFAPLQGQIGINSPFEIDGRSVSLTDLTIKMGSCYGSGSANMQLAQEATPFSITADLSGGSLDLDEFAFAREDDRSLASFPFAWPKLDIRLALKEAHKGKLALKNLSATLKGSAGTYRIDNFAATWAQGRITASSLLDLAGLRFGLSSQGKGLNLGKILEQLGVGGFASGKTAFSMQLSSTGRSAGEAIRHVSGSGRLTCDNLAIGLPAGVAFFMGKLGRNLPDVLDRVRINFLGEDGNLSFSPVTASGPGFEATGSASLQIASEQLSGKFILKALALEFPVSFEGPWGDLSWSFGRPRP